ncbi:MAG: hypothetical protein QHC89_07035 [Bosea sp. (in: a-proteobacteria)]|nr:hypothetical protein [Bosea sp. (in: a-proteobacteria)]
MEASIIIHSAEELKSLNLLATEQEFSLRLGRSENWMRTLRRKDGRASQQVRQAIAMRLQRHLTELKEQAAPSVAQRLGNLIDQVIEADWRARYLTRQVCP